MSKEKRKHPRIQKMGIMRLYTSLSTCKYTVNLRDISRGGAFIKTKHIPKMGEIVTYIIVDENSYKELFIGNAVVKWIKDKNCTEDEMGFGIELEKELEDEVFKAIAG